MFRTTLAADEETPLITKAIFGLAGVVLLVAAGAFGYDAAVFRDRAARADGVVIALRAGGSHPTIRFRDGSGAVFDFDANGLISGYAKGDRVRVLYDPAAPRRDAALAAFGSYWFFPVMLSVIGLGFLAVLLPLR